MKHLTALIFATYSVVAAFGQIDSGYIFKYGEKLFFTCSKKQLVDSIDFDYTFPSSSFRKTRYTYFFADSSLSMNGVRLKREGSWTDTSTHINAGLFFYDFPDAADEEFEVFFSPVYGVLYRLRYSVAVVDEYFNYTTGYLKNVNIDFPDPAQFTRD